MYVLVLVAPSPYSLRGLIINLRTIYKKKVKDYINFIPTKSKLFCFNTNNDDTSHITLNGQQVALVILDKHIGNCISSSINARHIIDNT